MISTGDKAPTVKLLVVGPNGARETAVPDGSPLLLYFYPKDDTPGCTTEAIEFSARKPEFEALGVKIVGVSPDPLKKHEKFAAKHSLSIDLAADEDQSTLNAYGVWVEKSMYGKTYMGVERSTFLIAGDGTIVEAWRKVRVQGHVDAVLEKAKAAFG